MNRLPLAGVVPEVGFCAGFTEEFTEEFCASREGFCVSREGFCEFCVGSLTVPEAAPENSAVSWSDRTACSRLLLSLVDIVLYSIGCSKSLTELNRLLQLEYHSDMTLIGCLCGGSANDDVD